MAKLKSLTIPVEALLDEHKERMFEIFQKYYANTSYETFLKDLSDKDIVFLLLDQKDQQIQGFSTLKNLKVSFENKIYHASFSGDTIIEKAYWGQGALGVAFLKYLLLQKLKNPFRPYYWFLISKGYKTYLLMANNFPVHYPRFEKETPRKEQDLIHSLGEVLYGSSYKKNLGLIRFDDSTQKDALKGDVAPITVDLLKNDRISYFVKKNPDWIKGDELACLAEMTLMMPIRYQMKIMTKGLRASWQKLSPLLGMGTRSS